MIERSIRTPDARAMEATVAEAPVRFEEFFDAEHARLFAPLHLRLESDQAVV